jgi:hypothetical protein
MPFPVSVRSLLTAVVAAVVSACAGSSPPVEQTAAVPAGTWCQVDVRNATEFALQTSYWLGARGGGTRYSLGVLDPEQSTTFGAPCVQGALQVYGVARAFGASLDRGQPSSSALAVLQPGETTLVVLRAR